MQCDFNHLRIVLTPFFFNVDLFILTFYSNLRVDAIIENFRFVGPLKVYHMILA